MTTRSATRRHFLKGSAVAGSGLVVSGCDALDFLSDRDNQVRRALESANSLTFRVQRLLLRGDQLAQEFSEADIRQPMRPNGVTRPDDANYANLLSGNFADFRLEVTGLVDKPLKLSLDQLRAMPSRTQITRHDCVEGWSCIAKWTATCPRESVLPIRLRPDYSVVFEGYAGWAEHWPRRREAGRVLSGPIFSGAVACANLVNSL